MGWVKLDDNFAEHPKVEEAGDLAAWLYVCGLQYCSRALSDGYIPAGRVPRLTMLKRPQQLADKLVEVGLWERENGGFRVHDYTEYQRSADQIKKEREAVNNRVKKHRAKQRRNASSNGAETALDVDKSR